ncbi:unnamed protein product [Ilex paraguariensis]|uniref:poly(A)-specific ribonuclease n=1 Tax=Ilex paraguariensis TaxID=185542 RepID=A0ABC8UD06_9AQUA
MVLVREVWAENMDKEFAMIRSTLVKYPYVSMDTEFPGVIFSPNVEKHMYSHLNPLDQYSWMKRNVDCLKLIQVGLTLCDSQGNLPDFGTNICYVWEFNFRGFDVDRHRYNLESIELLKRQGIDFAKNGKKGISFLHFSKLFLESGLVFNPSVTWVTFHGTYDFGFMIKTLTRERLPGDLYQFMELVKSYFGVTVYDMKHIMEHFGLYGGLEKVAKALEVDRVVGKSHQAGSDSLLAMQTFMKLTDIYFSGESRDILNVFNCRLYGLELGPKGNGLMIGTSDMMSPIVYYIA